MDKTRQPIVSELYLDMGQKDEQVEMKIAIENETPTDTTADAFIKLAQFMKENPNRRYYDYDEGKLFCGEEIKEIK